MQQSVDAMRVALQVLGAITEKREPAWEDIKELYRLAPPKDFMPLDELACAVVEQSLERYRAQREQPEMLVG
ncbi:MAG TPA: hypothetical protein VKB88_25430 [Bryobacteraceae bacterium]|nr:hypothetical protein [Bryobacteraceae bacterium]